MAKKLPPIPKGTEITGAITKHMDRRYLSSLDLMGLGVVELTVERVEKHDEIKYGNGSTDQDVILMYFVGSDKPLSLNTCNIKMIVRCLKTAKVSEWKGKKIKLEVQIVKAFGKMQPAVRVVG